MIRRLLLILAAIVVAAAGFGLYMWWQSPTASGPMKVDSRQRPSPRQSTPALNGVGESKKIFYKKYDEDGKLSTIFSADAERPSAQAGMVDLDNPDVEFFLGQGRRLVLTGKTGTMHLEQHGDRGKPNLLSGGNATPTNGSLDGVLVRIFEAENPGKPSTTIQTDNLSFDNQTLRFATESFVDTSGQTIPADQVPVTVRGEDMDFDGRGLVMYYDDLNKRIKSFEITHGQDMVLKRATEMLSGSSRHPATQPSAAGGGSGTPQTLPRQDSPSTRPKSLAAKVLPSAYRATFLDRVRVSQGDAPLAEADVLAIDFLAAGSGKHDEADADNTSDRAADGTGGRRHPATTQSTSRPTTRAVPIVIHWNGKLRVVAIGDQTVVPLLPGQAAIKMVGNPMMLHQLQGAVQCASLLYQTADRSTRLLGDNNTPMVTFTDTQNQTTLVTPELDYSDNAKTATLAGPGSVHVKQPSRPGQPATELNATWADHCLVKLFENSNAAQSIDAVGEVKVDHPQIKMSAYELLLAFRQVSKEPNKSLLHQMLATGEVNCDLSDKLNPHRTLQSDRVLVSTAQNGRDGMYAQAINATGAVHATDNDQSLTSDEMDLTFAPKPTVAIHHKPPTPSTAGAATTHPLEVAADQTQLQTFLARGHVQMNSKDASAQANVASVDETTGHAAIDLRGEPAVLTQQGRTVTGPHVIAREGLVAVDGPGTLHAVEFAATQPAAATTRPSTQPLDLAWSTSADVNGTKNLVTVNDKVILDTRQADGTIVHVTADQLVMALKDAPAAGPSTRPSGRSTTRGKSRELSGFDSLHNKAVQSATFVGHVVATSTLNGTDGGPQQRTLLRSDRLAAGFADGQQLATIDIPGAGQMLYDDYRAAKQDSGGGATAIGWDRAFHYDEAGGRVATITDQVVVTHTPPAGEKQDPLKLETSRMLITLPPRSLATGSTTRPSPASRPAAITTGIRSLSGGAPVVLTGNGLKVFAQSFEFSPVDHRMIIRGTDRQPVEFSSDGGKKTGTCDELWFNPETQGIENWINPHLNAQP